MRIHKEQGTILGGVHLELTGEVNEEGFSVVSQCSCNRGIRAELIADSLT
jgi:3-deoxy-D-arabino-heptulosonate 7-phosphate (DAHP) synthase class II